MTQQLRFWLAIALGAFLALFAVQNMGVVEVKLLLWTFETSRFFVIIVAFLIGLAIGWVIKSLQRMAKHAASHTTSPSTSRSSPDTSPPLSDSDIK